MFDGTTRLWGFCNCPPLPYWWLKAETVRWAIEASRETNDRRWCCSTNHCCPLYWTRDSTPLYSCSNERWSFDMAMRAIKVLYNQLTVGCFSHTLDHVGNRMKTPVFNNFGKVWIGMFSQSLKIRLHVLWRIEMGQCVHSYSTTRRLSRFEVIDQLLEAFGDVQTFLSNDNLPKPLQWKLAFLSPAFSLSHCSALENSTPLTYSHVCSHSPISKLWLLVKMWFLVYSIYIYTSHYYAIHCTRN